MSDDLRADGRDCPIDCKCPTRYVKWDDGSEHDSGRICQLHTYIAEAATDPVRRLAILNLIGDVSEMRYASSLIVGAEPGPLAGYWVVPRGEATDA